jgi:hypothetical protein
MTIALPDDYEFFIAWRFIYDNYLREEILGYKRPIKPLF